jgi:hypothetical protein
MELLLVGGLLCGLINGIPLGQDLIELLPLRSWMLSISICSKKGCIDCAHIISPFSLIVVAFRGAKDLLSLKICG